MPSSTSNFKRKLRLPRLFFAEPSEIVPRDYERPIPPIPWRGITVIVILVVIAASTAWELYCRSIGYGPTLNDNEVLWTSIRRRVQPESVVIIGDSRAWFDLEHGRWSKICASDRTRVGKQEVMAQRRRILPSGP